MLLIAASHNQILFEKSLNTMNNRFMHLIQEALCLIKVEWKMRCFGAKVIVEMAVFLDFVRL